MSNKKITIGIYSLFAQNVFVKTTNKLGGAEKQAGACAKFLAHAGYNIAFMLADPGRLKRKKTLYPRITAYYHPKYALNGVAVRKKIFKSGLFNKIVDKVRNLTGKEPLQVPEINKGKALKPFKEVAAKLWAGWTLIDPMLELAKACNEKSIPFLLALASDADLDFLDFPYGRDQFGSCREKKQVTMEMCTAVVVQNKWQETMMRKHLPQKPLFYLPNPIALPPINAKSPKQKKGLLWIGKFDNNKNAMAFLQLALLLPDVPMLMIANPADPDIENQVRKKSPSNLKIISSVPYEEIGTYIDAAAIHVSTSFLEGFPNTFLEAAAHLTPTFSLHVDPDELMSKGILGYCFSGNLDKMADAIKEGLSNSGQLLEMGKKARAYVEKVHDSEVVSREWLHIVEQVLELPCAE